MKIVVLTTDKPGISTSLVGDQTVKALKDLGHEVVRVDTDGKAGTPVNTKEFSRNHVICLLEHKVPAILDQIRFSRPLSLLSVWTGNVEGYETPELLQYMSHFFAPKFGGVPVRHISHSHHTQEKLRAVATQYLNASTATAFASNCTTVLYGIDDVFKPGPNDCDLLIVPMNRVVQGAKQVGLHAEITSMYHSLAAINGFNVKSKFYYAPGFGPQDKKLSVDLSIYDFQVQPEDRAQYVANAREAGTFLSVSQWESFGIYYLELLASGVVGVFLDKPWVRKLLPNYKLIGAKSDLAPMLLEVRRNPSKWRNYLIEEVIPEIKSKYTLPRFAEGLTTQIDRLTDHITKEK